MLYEVITLADNDTIRPDDLPQALRFSGDRGGGGIPAEMFSTRDDVLPLEKA